MPDLNLTYFQGLKGARFMACPGEDSLILDLMDVRPGRIQPGWECFSLLFRGSAQRMLPQGMWKVAAPGGETIDLFLVPVGREEDLYLYEAVFNLPNPSLT